MELLTPEAMKIFKGAGRRITVDKNGKNMPQREFTKVVLVPCNGQKPIAT